MAAAFEGNYAARGSVSLKSNDPKDPPVIDPKFLVEPYDRRVAIEAVREALKLIDSPQMAKGQVRLATGPEDRTDEAILVCSILIPRFENSLIQDTFRTMSAKRQSACGTAAVLFRWVRKESPAHALTVVFESVESRDLESRT